MSPVAVLSGGRSVHSLAQSSPANGTTSSAMARKLRVLALHSFRTSGKTFALQVCCSVAVVKHTKYETLAAGVFR